MKDAVLDYFVKGIREQLGEHLRRVILFGSRARGEETSSSDYDFASSRAFSFHDV